MSGKSLLSIKMQTITSAEAHELRQQGMRLTPAFLNEPEHAPRGTRFVLVDMGTLGKRPYRVHEKGAKR